MNVSIRKFSSYGFLNVFLQSKDKHGITAILAAIWEGHTSCVKLLLEKVRHEYETLLEIQTIFVYRELRKMASHQMERLT